MDILGKTWFYHCIGQGGGGGGAEWALDLFTRVVRVCQKQQNLWVHMYTAVSYIYMPWNEMKQRLNLQGM